MRRPVGRKKPVISTRLAFLLIFTVFYWVFHFIIGRTSLQMSQVVFDIFTGVFTGAVIHVAIAKGFGPLLFGRGFCGWACWNASLFEILPVRGEKKKLAEHYLMYKYIILVIVLVLPVILIFCGLTFQDRKDQLKWLLIENGIIYFLGAAMAFVLSDRRAFCKYLCPAGALMTITSPMSVIKVERNHLKCSKCRRCEEACPMDIPILNYISSNQRVSHPECILCAECIKVCPTNCLTVGIGRKSTTTPEFGKSY